MKSKNNRNTLILLGLLVLVLAVSYPLLNKSSDTTDTTSTDQSAAVVEAQNTLAKMQGINIDFSIFDSSEFMHLIDITSPLLNLPVGRANPFAPIK